MKTLKITIPKESAYYLDDPWAAQGIFTLPVGESLPSEKIETVVNKVRQILARNRGAAERLTKDLSENFGCRFVLATTTNSETDAGLYDFNTYSESDSDRYLGAKRSSSDVQAVPAPRVVHDVKPEDEIIAMVRGVSATDGEEAALGSLYGAYHPLILAAEHRDFVRANRILRQVKVDEFPVSVLIGFLMMTFAHKDKFSERGEFFKRVKVKVTSTADAAEVMPYLADLE